VAQYGNDGMSSSTPHPPSTASVEASHRRLLDRLASLTDTDVSAPSRLPDWSVGHVLTHIARNADGQRRMMAGAAAGEVRDMYPAGREGRSADIELGAHRSADELRHDIATATAALEAAWASLPAEAWGGRGRMFIGEIAIGDIPFLRQREVEVHHLDLGLGYVSDDWPADYVGDELRRLTTLWASRQPMGLTTLPNELLREPEHRRVLWLLGRSDVDGLDRCTIF
jgi:maleylpyruvate isomerase